MLAISPYLDSLCSMPQLNGEERAYARALKDQGLKATEICDKILALRRQWHKAAKVRPFGSGGISA